MRLWMKWMSIFNSISPATLLALLALVASLNACSAKPPGSVILPDSHELTAGVVCNDHGECVPDPKRVTIDLGYLREIMDTLDACRKGSM